MGTPTRRVRLTAAVGAVCGAMLFLLFVRFLGGLLESRQCLIPKFGKMVAEKGQALGIELVDAARAGAAVANEAGLFEHAQVLRNRGTGNWQAGGEFIHGARRRAEHLENGQAGGVAKGGESVLYVSIHLR